MKPYIATAKGGYVLTSEIIAVEPTLCMDNRWRPVAYLRGGASFELDFEAHGIEGVQSACDMLMQELWQAKVWGDRYGYSGQS